MWQISYSHFNSMSEPDHSSSNRPNPINWVVVCVVIFPITALLLLAACPRTSSKGFAALPKGKAQQIITLLHMYAAGHDGHFPDNLEALIEIKPQSLDILKIELEDGIPPRHWIYHRGLSETTPANEWVLVSPPLVNNKISRYERWWREYKGGFQPPPERPVRMLARKDGTVKYMPETEFQEIMKREHIILPDASIDAKSK